MAEPAQSASAWSPFRHPVFRDLWMATVVSNVGTWMQSLGAAWLMTTISASPVMVALVQSATSFPMFLLALPAGALADIIDRRRLLLFTQGWMLAAAALLAAVTFLGATTPWVLLVLTFVLGLGAALNGPAWQAIVPELVPRRELSEAIALNSAGFNLSRAAGPAAGGAVLAAAGAAVTFLLNAISFLGVMMVLFRWRRPPMETHLPAERMLSAMRSGLRYTRYAPALRAVLLRSCVFMIGSSAVWALLPLVARNDLRWGPIGYGILLACFGAGALAGATILPRVRRRLSSEQLVTVGTLAFAAVNLAMALLPVMGVLGPALFVGGMAWLVLVSSFNVAVQITVPAWVRARALAVYTLAFAGGLSLGSAVWGAIAAHQGISTTLIYAAIFLALSLLFILHHRLEIDEELDLTPSLHWSEPILAIRPHLQRGPVLVTVEYRLDARHAEAFMHALRALGMIRRRDGAVGWGLFQDMAEPERFLEAFMVESWAEHLRQHERMTKADIAVEERVRSFHLGAQPPVVSHFLYAYGKRVRKFKDHSRVWEAEEPLE